MSAITACRTQQSSAAMSRLATTAAPRGSPTTPAATSLSEVSGTGPDEVVDGPAGRNSLPVPYFHLVSTLPAPTSRSPSREQDHRLHDPIQGRRRRHDGACRQSAQAGRQDRWPRGSTYLGAGLDPSSARPLRRAGRRSLIRWDTMVAARLLLLRHQTTLPVVPASASNVCRRSSTPGCWDFTPT